MKRIITVMILCFFVGSLQAQKQEKEKVKATITQFFEAFHAKDTAQLKTFCHPKMLMQSIAEKPTTATITADGVANFMKSIASIPAGMAFKEELKGFHIQVNGAMAHAWTPYVFSVNGKVSHTGINAFTFVKNVDTWQIVHLIDTRKK